MSLADRPCPACHAGTPPITDPTPLLAELRGWTIEGGHLTKTWRFPDFREGLRFVDRVGDVADEAGHHPDVYLAWGKVRIELWTHAIGALSEADFVLAARLDRL